MVGNIHLSYSTKFKLVRSSAFSLSSPQILTIRYMHCLRQINPKSASECCADEILGSVINLKESAGSKSLLLLHLNPTLKERQVHSYSSKVEKLGRGQEHSFHILLLTFWLLTLWRFILQTCSWVFYRTPSEELDTSGCKGSSNFYLIWYVSI